MISAQLGLQVQCPNRIKDIELGFVFIIIKIWHDPGPFRVSAVRNSHHIIFFTFSPIVSKQSLIVKTSSNKCKNCTGQISYNRTFPRNRIKGLSAMCLQAKQCSQVQNKDKDCLEPSPPIREIKAPIAWSNLACLQILN